LQCGWRDTEVEGDVESVQRIAKEIRSARANYNLLNNTKTEGKNRFKQVEALVELILWFIVFVKCSDSKLKAHLVPLTSAIATLAYCSKVDFDATPPSSGCAILTISDKCEVHLVLQVHSKF